ncbi:2,5-didehydrogluconate reductase DkgB [Microbulbifer sp. CNSA002]|uniref:2,5-didehydrogluconate reductase DkgB n=1 Tax=Microbulbifer sp. CNSA002 TaxID=3373604 RepID=UPI0039B3A20F
MSELPSLGMGTFRLEGDVAIESVKQALEAGYRHIDTAQIYGNESEVGIAIKKSGITREELFLTTKVWLDNLTQEAFISSVEVSLKKLKVESVDLLLIHWPEKDGRASMETYLKLLAQCQQKGLTKHIGVSNFTIKQLDNAIDILGEGKIYTNQIEVHPYLQNTAVIEHCKKRGITVTDYMPLAVGKVMSDDVLLKIAERYNATPAQIAIAWQLKQGLVTIPSSTKRKNLDANLEALKITLTDEDMRKISALEAGERIANPEFAPYWD